MNILSREEKAIRSLKSARSAMLCTWRFKSFRFMHKSFLSPLFHKE
jgi:hypothetical protein